ncbi:hypothetical protein GCM10009579_57260 [Streptomyces javensis]|uniref:Uncharacterized protein n=1 Tax=Streptomyces javensis TaxID=114698 RepID=A0ABN1X7X7_9ACTN
MRRSLTPPVPLGPAPLGPARSEAGRPPPAPGRGRARHDPATPPPPLAPRCQAHPYRRGAQAGDLHEDVVAVEDGGAVGVAEVGGAFRGGDGEAAAEPDRARLRAKD